LEKFAIKYWKLTSCHEICE